MNRTVTKPDTVIIDQITSQIVEHFHPQRLILFGSRARGDAREDSDFDLLIIAPSNEPRWRRTVPVYHMLAGLGVPKEIVWWTPEEIAEWRSATHRSTNHLERANAERNRTSKGQAISQVGTPST